MPLAEGSRLGPYEIGASIGAGGMGEVYRARDTRLDRDVAVKVLPAAVSSDADARGRLTREARALSQLSHPHICALYDVGQHGDTDYIVMELVDGETLAARMARGPLPLAQGIEIGAQIADALDRAHRAGIVHRDLKPSNVMLTAQGAKLLDFGLARSTAALAQKALGDGTTILRSGVTAVGTIVGTIQYMSPEQLESRPADARSDIFALGLVLFEMATGRRAFEGTSSAAIAAAILATDPPAVSSLKQAAPAALDRVVRLCLEKNPDARWQSAHDVSVLLRTMDATVKVESPARGRLAARWLPWVLAAAAGTAALVLWSRPAAVAPSAAPMTAVFEVAPPGSGFSTSVEANSMALSPDGSRLAWIAASGGIWIRPLPSATAAPLAGAEHANAVFWSPDGRSIGFFGSGTLSRIDAAGGAAVVLCEVSRWSGHTGTWGNDGIVFSSIAAPVIFRVPTAGGPAVELIKPDPSRREFKVQWPLFLPDGRRLLYTAWREDRTARLMLWEPDRPVREIMAVSSNVEYADPGYLLFVRDGTLLAQRFDPVTATIAGDPAAVTQPVIYQAIPGIGHFTTSARNGVLAYQSHNDQSRVAWFDRSGRELGTALPSNRYAGVRFTPDGRQLMFSRGTKGVGTFDLWTLDVARGVEELVTSDRGNELPGLKTADRSTFVYSAGPFGPPKIQIRDAGTGAERSLRPEGGGMQWADDLTANGDTLIFRERSSETGRVALFAAPFKGGEARAVLDTRFSYMGARLSPDGKWLAYISDETQSLELYLARWPDARDKVRVSADGAFRVQWGPEGRELFYVSRAGLMSVPMSSGGPGKPQLLIDRAKTGTWSDFDVTADGRFIAIVSESVAARQPLTVMLNWQSRLK